MITSLTAVLLASVGVAQEAFDLERLIEQGRVEELVQIATENPDRFEVLGYPLIEVAEDGLLPVVRALVEGGMGPHQVRIKTMIFEELPQTAVSVSLAGGYLDVAQYLLEAGGKPEGYGWLLP